MFLTLILVILILAMMAGMAYFYMRLQKCCKDDEEVADNNVHHGEPMATAPSSMHTHQPGIYKCPISGKSFGPNDAIDVVINNRHIPVCSMQCKDKIKDIAVLLTMN